MEALEVKLPVQYGFSGDFSEIRDYLICLSIKSKIWRQFISATVLHMCVNWSQTEPNPYN